VLKKRNSSSSRPATSKTYCKNVQNSKKRRLALTKSSNKLFKVALPIGAHPKSLKLQASYNNKTKMAVRSP